MTPEPTGLAPVREPLVERLHQFMDELRARGLPLALSERIDAMRAVAVLGFERDRNLHTALSATLVKASEHQAAFDEIFDLYFRSGRSSLPNEADDAQRDDSVARFGPFDLDEAVRSVLRDGSEALARLVAERAVAQFAGFERGRAVGGAGYELRTIRGLRLDDAAAEIAAEIVGEAGRQPGAGPSGSTSPGRQLGFDLEHDSVAERVAELRRQIRQVIRELLIADRGVEAVAKTIRTPLPADIDIMMATPAQLAEIDRLLRTLQRKIATTLERKRRHRTGPLDLGRTVRASMATGGVPIRVVHRRPIATKPQLFVLADVSGSVASFAAFTISLVSAMSQEFSKLRAFAFVGRTIEVTELFKATSGPVKAVQAINALEGPTFLHARTDYGRALTQFEQAVGSEVGRRSTILIFGDARGNYLAPEVQVLTRIAKRARALYWLNPEQPNLWGSGDSLMPVYARHCTEALSCRTLGDLRRFVERLA